ncbi:A24 family peptidase [uncultured Actinomyces sp.]|uniref:prepilin peptidase n=1 Tax=uncultured Actinomyces sp. TaxID=249061 RepID=UPI0026189703|nr:A24 family peptidase [uncultured Actinomyces sp.]
MVWMLLFPLLATLWTVVAWWAVRYAQRYTGALPHGVLQRSWPLELGVAMPVTLLLGTATLVVGTYHKDTAFLVTLPLGLVVFLVPACLTDLACHRLPNLLLGAAAVWGSACAGLLIFMVLTLTNFLEAKARLDRHEPAVTYSSFWDRPPGQMLWASGVIIWPAVVIGLIMWLLSSLGTGLGMGDVKLSTLLSAWLCLSSWQAPFVGLALGMVLGGLASLVLVATRRATLRTAVPLGPPLFLGAWLVWAGTGLG